MSVQQFRSRTPPRKGRAPGFHKNTSLVDISDLNATGRQKEKDGKKLCVKNVTGQLLASFVVIFSYKKTFYRKMKFGGTFFSDIIIVTLVTKGLPSCFPRYPSE